MHTADLWITGNPVPAAPSPAALSPAMARRPRGTAPAGTSPSRPSGDRTVHFDVVEERAGRWGWSLRDAYGQDIARSPMPYPSRVQASAAALAFSQLVAHAGKQMRRP